MRNRRRRGPRIGRAIVLLWLASAAWQAFKPLPPGLGIEGPWRSAEHASFLADRTHVDAAGVAGDEVYAAMTGNPAMVGGDGRDVTKFMRHVPGLMAKDGADGVFAAALPDGRAIALKVADGGDRARPPLMVAALQALGVDTSAVAALVEERIMGHGHQVGTVRAIAP
mgnify:CR=1 FL=1